MGGSGYKDLYMPQLNAVRVFLFCCVLFTSTTLAYAQQSLTVLRNANLREKPVFDSAIVFSVTSDAPAVTIAKKGPWLLVRFKGHEGWVLTTDVIYGGGSTRPPQRVGNSIPVFPRAPPPDSEQTESNRLQQKSEAQLKLLDEYAKPYEPPLADARTVRLTAAKQAQQA